MEEEQTTLVEGPAPETTETEMHVPQQTSDPVSKQLQSTTSTTSAPSSNSITICGVCQAGQSKYKCPRCYLPYCSVACNKVHKENHPPDPEPNPVPKPDAQETQSTGTNIPPHNPSNPFHALDTSEKLQHLFHKYPSLSQQLLDIYAATQPPTEAPDKRIPASLTQGFEKKDNWNHDIGIKNGKEALRKARRAKGEAGEAVREYSELILHLINTQDDKGQVTTALQQQAAQEDSKLIEQLLAQERR
ncbi:hypothetical protein QQS21_010884 [Conoideocrella luteorostrata]|uniref:HIT-type domain-containing protein n=1 Tax=Conoideocrella luteorostrata TaxID=1105319 RepID=A0AAJ0FWE3_9HYPO|nr:hypothetical protein QQS21_010884 [Conoideocrella luteorostrata]